MGIPCCKELTHIHTDTLQADQAEEEDHVFCAACHKAVTQHRYRIAVQGQWTHVYANPYGIVFEIACFKTAGGALLLSMPSDEFSWFSGYSWRIAGCSRCNAHLGWQFISPGHSFYGLILDNLINI